MWGLHEITSEKCCNAGGNNRDFGWRSRDAGKYLEPSPFNPCHGAGMSNVRPDPNFGCYRAYPEAIDMQASGLTKPPTVDNHLGGS